MNELWTQTRIRLFCKTNPSDFKSECAAFRDEQHRAYVGADKIGKAATEELIANITIDMQSDLLKWNLCKPYASECLTDKDLHEEVEKNYDLLNEIGCGPAIEKVRKKVEHIVNSNLYKLAQATRDNKLNVFWGNDAASGIEDLMRYGATLVTTNPPIVNIERKEHPEHWEKVKRALRKSNPAASAERLAILFTKEIVLANCRALRPVFEASGGYKGYANYQVNPMHCNDAEAMAEEIICEYKEMTEALGGPPNVLFKVPGSKAALKTAEMVTGMGIGVTITGSFSVNQHIEFAKVIEKGKAKVSYLVMMMGRLDGPVKDELMESGIEKADELAKHASESVIRRSYNLLYNERGFKKSEMLVASLRGPWNILASITDDATPINISIFPNKREEFEMEPREMVPVTERPLCKKTLAMLENSQIFRKAYHSGEMTADGFDEYPPLVATLDGFKKDYSDLMEYMMENERRECGRRND